jgi:hypothetical protein
LLTANTEAGYRAWVASRPVASASGGSTKARSNDPVGAFIGGVAAGLLLGKK